MDTVAHATASGHHPLSVSNSSAIATQSRASRDGVAGNFAALRSPPHVSVHHVACGDESSALVSSASQHFDAPLPTLVRFDKSPTTATTTTARGSADDRSAAAVDGAPFGSSEGRAASSSSLRFNSSSSAPHALEATAEGEGLRSHALAAPRVIATAASASALSSSASSAAATPKHSRPMRCLQKFAAASSVSSDRSAKGPVPPPALAAVAPTVAVAPSPTPAPVHVTTEERVVSASSNTSVITNPQAQNKNAAEAVAEAAAEGNSGGPFAAPSHIMGNTQRSATNDGGSDGTAFAAAARKDSSGSNNTNGCLNTPPLPSPSTAAGAETSHPPSLTLRPSDVASVPPTAPTAVDMAVAPSVPPAPHQLAVAAGTAEGTDDNNNSITNTAGSGAVNGTTTGSNISASLTVPSSAGTFAFPTAGRALRERSTAASGAYGGDAAGSPISSSPLMLTATNSVVSSQSSNSAAMMLMLLGGSAAADVSSSLPSYLSPPPRVGGIGSGGKAEGGNGSHSGSGDTAAPEPAAPVSPPPPRVGGSSFTVTSTSRPTPSSAASSLSPTRASDSLSHHRPNEGLGLPHQPQRPNERSSPLIAACRAGTSPPLGLARWGSGGGSVVAATSAIAHLLGAGGSRGAGVGGVATAQLTGRPTNCTAPLTVSDLSDAAPSAPSSLLPTPMAPPFAAHVRIDQLPSASASASIAFPHSDNNVAATLMMGGAKGGIEGLVGMGQRGAVSSRAQVMIGSAMAMRRRAVSDESLSASSNGYANEGTDDGSSTSPTSPESPQTQGGDGTFGGYNSTQIFNFSPRGAGVDGVTSMRGQGCGSPLSFSRRSPASRGGEQPHRNASASASPSTPQSSSSVSKGSGAASSMGPPPPYASKHSHFHPQSHSPSALSKGPSSPQQLTAGGSSSQRGGGLSHSGSPNPPQRSASAAETLNSLADLLSGYSSGGTPQSQKQTQQHSSGYNNNSITNSGNAVVAASFGLTAAAAGGGGAPAGGASAGTAAASLFMFPPRLAPPSSGLVANPIHSSHGLHRSGSGCGTSSFLSGCLSPRSDSGTAAAVAAPSAPPLSNAGPLFMCAANPYSVRGSLCSDGGSGLKTGAAGLNGGQSSIAVDLATSNDSDALALLMGTSGGGGPLGDLPMGGPSSLLRTRSNNSSTFSAGHRSHPHSHNVVPQQGPALWQNNASSPLLLAPSRCGDGNQLGRLSGCLDESGAPAVAMAGMGRAVVGTSSLSASGLLSGDSSRSSSVGAAASQRAVVGFAATGGGGGGGALAATLIPNADAFPSPHRSRSLGGDAPMPNNDSALMKVLTSPPMAAMAAPKVETSPQPTTNTRTACSLPFSSPTNAAVVAASALVSPTNSSSARGGGRAGRVGSGDFVDVLGSPLSPFCAASSPSAGLMVVAADGMSVGRGGAAAYSTFAFDGAPPFAEGDGLVGGLRHQQHRCIVVSSTSLPPSPETRSHGSGGVGGGPLSSPSDLGPLTPPQPQPIAVGARSRASSASSSIGSSMVGQSMADDTFAHSTSGQHRDPAIAGMGFGFGRGGPQEECAPSATVGSCATSSVVSGKSPAHVAAFGATRPPSMVLCEGATGAPSSSYGVIGIPYTAHVPPACAPSAAANAQQRGQATAVLPPPVAVAAPPPPQSFIPSAYGFGSSPPRQPPPPSSVVGTPSPTAAASLPSAGCGAAVGGGAVGAGSGAGTPVAGRMPSRAALKLLGRSGSTVSVGSSLATTPVGRSPATSSISAVGNATPPFVPQTLSPMAGVTTLNRGGLFAPAPPQFHPPAAMGAAAGGASGVGGSSVGGSTAPAAIVFSPMFGGGGKTISKIGGIFAPTGPAVLRTVVGTGSGAGMGVGTTTAAPPFRSPNTSSSAATLVASPPHVFTRILSAYERDKIAKLKMLVAESYTYQRRLLRQRVETIARQCHSSDGDERQSPPSPKAAVGGDVGEGAPACAAAAVQTSAKKETLLPSPQAAPPSPVAHGTPHHSPSPSTPPSSSTADTVSPTPQAGAPQQQKKEASGNNGGPVLPRWLADAAAEQQRRLAKEFKALLLQVPTAWEGEVKAMGRGVLCYRPTIIGDDNSGNGGSGGSGGGLSAGGQIVSPRPMLSSHPTFPAPILAPARPPSAANVSPPPATALSPRGTWPSSPSNAASANGSTASGGVGVTAAEVSRSDVDGIYEKLRGRFTPLLLWDDLDGVSIGYEASVREARAAREAEEQRRQTALGAALQQQQQHQQQHAHTHSLSSAALGSGFGLGPRRGSACGADMASLGYVSRQHSYGSGAGGSSASTPTASTASLGSGGGLPMPNSQQFPLRFGANRSPPAATVAVHRPIIMNSAGTSGGLPLSPPRGNSETRSLPNTDAAVPSSPPHPSAPLPLTSAEDRYRRVLGMPPYALLSHMEAAHERRVREEAQRHGAKVATVTKKAAHRSPPSYSPMAPQRRR